MMTYLYGSGIHALERSGDLPAPLKNKYPEFIIAEGRKTGQIEHGRNPAGPFH